MSYTNKIPAGRVNLIALEQMLRRNQEVLIIFPLEELQQEWRQSRIRTAHKLAGYVAPAKDSLTAMQLCRELGIHGRVAVTTAADGSSYVIVKGYPGTRTILTGTRYLTTHPKIVQLAIGRVGLAGTVLEGGMLTIVLYAGIDVLDYILNEHATLAMLSANLATDLLKVGISSVASAAVGLLAGGFTTLAVGPLAAAIFVGIITGFALDYFDKQYGITDKLAALIDEYAHELAKRQKEMQESLGRAPHEIERSLIWRMYRWDIDNPRGF